MRIFGHYKLRFLPVSLCVVTMLTLLSLVKADGGNDNFKTLDINIGIKKSFTPWERSLYDTAGWSKAKFHSFLEQNKQQSDLKFLNSTKNIKYKYPPFISHSLFQTTDQPGEASNNDGNGGIEVGVKFQVTESGTIDKIRFYKGQTTEVSYVVHLWAPNVTEPIATSTVYTTGTIGWHEVAIAPVTIEVGVTYIASCYNALGFYCATGNYFTVPKENGPLTALAHTVAEPNGVFKYGVSGRPTSGSAEPNYWVDVVFTPSTSGGGGGGTISGTLNYVAKFTAANTVGNSILFENGTSVGIGTTNINNPDYKLFVQSGVRTKKIKVDMETNWPDYVFDDKYELPSLQEVEKYIKEHKHLPEVPSAKEVGETGLNLGENQALLLKKIEELTLYLIEENRTKEQLKERIKTLEEKIQKLSGGK